MKYYIKALICICLSGLLAMFLTVNLIGLMVDDLDPSKTDTGLAWAGYVCVWGPVAGVCGCVLGGLIFWRMTRLGTTSNDDRPMRAIKKGLDGQPTRYYTCPDCAAGGIIPAENGRCTNCGYRLY